MTDQMNEPTTDQAPLPGLLARAIGVLTSPKALFEKLVANPKVFGAMALVATLQAVTIGGFMMTTVGKDLVQTAFEATNPSAQAVEGFTKMLPYMGAMYAVVAFIVTPILTFICAGFLYVIFNVAMGGTATFRQVAAIVAHSQLIGSVGAMFSVALNYSRKSMESATSLRAFFPDVEPNSIQAKLLGGADVFLLWWIFVVAVGLAVLYRKKTAGIFVGLVVAYFAVLAGWAAIFSGRTNS